MSNEILFLVDYTDCHQIELAQNIPANDILKKSKKFDKDSLSNNNRSFITDLRQIRLGT